MKKEDNTLEKQMGTTLKKLARELRETKDPKPEVINAVARLYKEHRKFINADHDEDESEGNDYYALLESPNGPPICDPDAKKKKIIRRR